MTAIMFVSAFDKAIEIIKEFEGCKLKAYRCPAGIWTIGWGETKGIKEGMIWTQEEADERLSFRVADFIGDVLVSCPQLKFETDNKLAACTSLAYNIGSDAFAKSTVCRLTNKKEYFRAADAFLWWNKANGKVLPGLLRRRKAERELYLKD